MNKESKVYKFFYGLFSFLFSVLSIFLTLSYILIIVAIFAYGLRMGKIYVMSLNEAVGVTIVIYALGLLMELFKNTFFKN